MSLGSLLLGRPKLQRPKVGGGSTDCAEVLPLRTLLSWRICCLWGLLPVTPGFLAGLWDGALPRVGYNS